MAGGIVEWLKVFDPQLKGSGFKPNVPQSNQQEDTTTHMVRNVKAVGGHADTVSTHLVDQVFPDDHDLLAAVLNPANASRYHVRQQFSDTPHNVVGGSNPGTT